MIHKKIFLIYRQVIPLNVRRRIKATYYFLRTITGLEPSFTTFDAYKKRYPDHISCLKSLSYQLYYSYPQYLCENNNELYKDGEKMFACIFKIRGASCFAGSDVISLHNNSLIYELRDVYSSKLNRINCSDGVVVIKDEKCYRHIKEYRVTKNVSSGIMLSGIFDINYYHFTFQQLCKMKETMFLDPSIPLLISRRVFQVNNYKELLNYLNVQNRSFILLDENVRYKVDMLYYIPLQMLSVPSYKDGAIMCADDDQYCFDTLKFLRNNIIAYKSTDINVSDRIFISRRKASIRRSYNEMECFNMLINYGFVEVFPEEMSIAEQVAIFNNARYIVGASGAAFTNLIYCSKHCKVLILTGFIADFSGFSSLARLSNCEITYLYDKSHGALNNAKNEHSDFCIDINELENYVKKMLHSSIL